MCLLGIDNISLIIHIRKDGCTDAQIYNARTHSRTHKLTRLRILTVEYGYIKHGRVLQNRSCFKTRGQMFERNYSDYVIVGSKKCINQYNDTIDIRYEYGNL